MDFNVYEQYFAASHPGGGTPRRGARAALVVSTGEGRVRYEAALSFFPHEDAEDFRISYDLSFSRVLYEAKGRRSKKREAALLAGLRETLDALAAEAGGEVYWDRPLIAPRFG
ncbi:MAG: hypothetical protein IK095_00695 [Oscillospiraceae bacterium]|nr:hypothetical protein [Oscillospiraceae bacterium]